MEEKTRIEELEAEVRQLKFLNWKYKERLKEKMYIVDVVERKLESIKDEIQRNLKRKHSGQYILFNVEKNDVFSEPMFIKADSMEEALMPEDESYQRDFIFAIPCMSEFKDL